MNLNLQPPDKHHPTHLYTYRSIKRLTQTGKTSFTLQKLTKYHNIKTDKNKPDEEQLKDELRRLIKFGVLKKPNNSNPKMSLRITGQIEMAKDSDKIFKQYCEEFKNQFKLESFLHGIFNRKCDLEEYNQDLKVNNLSKSIKRSNPSSKSESENSETLDVMITSQGEGQNHEGQAVENEISKSLAKQKINSGAYKHAYKTRSQVKPKKLKVHEADSIIFIDSD